MFSYQLTTILMKTFKNRMKKKNLEPEVDMHVGMAKV